MRHLKDAPQELLNDLAERHVHDYETNYQDFDQVWSAFLDTRPTILQAYDFIQEVRGWAIELDPDVKI